MWLNVVALILLGVFIGMGILRGALASFVGLAAFVGGYAAAIAAAPTLAGWLPLSPETPGIVGVALAGCLVFAVTYAAILIAGTLVRRAQRERAGDGHSLRDRFLGGLFGALRGAFVVVLVSWLVLWLDALPTTGAPPLVPTVEGSLAARATSAVVEASVGAALAGNGSAGAFVARLAARPASGIEQLQALLANPRFEALREDAAFWSYVEAGAVDTALGRVSFRDLAHDAQLRGELAALGLVPPQAGDDPAAFEVAAAEALREVGPRLRGLREDPALQELMQDPAVAEMVGSGDHLGLLAHPGFRQLVARAASPSP
jgi:uncharacterized membrane protein required for colicin V production